MTAGTPDAYAFITGKRPSWVHDLATRDEWCLVCAKHIPIGREGLTAQWKGRKVWVCVTCPEENIWCREGGAS